MKGSEEIKGAERVFNYGEFAAIKRLKMPINQFSIPLEFEWNRNRELPCRIVGTPSPQSTDQGLLAIVRTLTGQSLVPYANGVPSPSPGLRGTRYPGSLPRKTSQPQRGCAPCDATPANPGGTTLRFGSFAAHEPRVGLIAFGQPWAEGRKPVGLMDSGSCESEEHMLNLVHYRLPCANTRAFGACDTLNVKMRCHMRPFPQSFNALEFEGFRRHAPFLQIVRSLAAQSPAPYANGVPSSSPELRGTRYPGSSPRKTSQPQRGCARAVSSRALETARIEILTALDGFLTGLGYLK
jgi:hypothetical protein